MVSSSINELLPASDYTKSLLWTHYARVFFSGTKIGAIIINKTFEKLNAMYRAKFVNEVIINIIEIILIAFISIVIYNVMLIFTLSKISAICRDIANGKKSTFQKFTQAPNEIGMFAQVLEKLFEALDSAPNDKG